MGNGGNRFGGQSYNRGGDSLMNLYLQHALLSKIREKKQQPAQPAQAQPGMGFTVRPTGFMSSSPSSPAESAAFNERIRDKAVYGSYGKGGLKREELGAQALSDVAKRNMTQRDRADIALKNRDIREKEAMGKWKRGGGEVMNDPTGTGTTPGAGTGQNLGGERIVGAPVAPQAQGTGIASPPQGAVPSLRDMAPSPSQSGGGVSISQRALANMDKPARTWQQEEGKYTLENQYPVRPTFQEMPEGKYMGSDGKRYDYGPPPPYTPPTPEPQGPMTTYNVPGEYDPSGSFLPSRQQRSKAPADVAPPSRTDTGMMDGARDRPWLSEMAQRIMAEAGQAPTTQAKPPAPKQNKVVSSKDEVKKKKRTYKGKGFGDIKTLLLNDIPGRPTEYPSSKWNLSLRDLWKNRRPLSPYENEEE